MFNTFTKTQDLKPFTKWVGGKRQLLTNLKDLLPKSFNNYYEPFIGGGALLFELAPKSAIINDYNDELINVYRTIKEAPTELIELLQKHQDNNSKDYYLDLRSVDRDGRIGKMTDAERAARTLYMLKVDFNGIYRVNSKGQFNVPYGRYKNPKIVDKENLITVHNYLKNNDVQIFNGDFENCLKSAKKDDLVYFDPPYIPLTETANFTSYTKTGFDIYDQERLRDVFFSLSKKGVKVMLSNSDTPTTRSLYEGANIHEVKATRMVNSNAKKRGKVGELIITSYEV